MIGDNVTEIKITPETYQKMNEEFIEDDIPFRIAVPTQEAIDKWQSQPPQHIGVVHNVDMVAEMWKLENERIAKGKLVDSLCVVYSNGSQECDRAKSLLESLGGEFLEYRLNNHFTQRSFESEFGSGAPYPQIAIGAKHIGDLKDTLHYCSEKGLLP
jgi:hypothetical protein